MVIHEPDFWGSWKGQIIRAIALDGAKTWEEIQNLTSLSSDTLNLALSELYNLEILHKKSNGTYWINHEIRDEYRIFNEQFMKPRTLAGNKMQVFISYAFSDKEFMKILCNELKRYEIRTYVAVHDSRPGESLPNKIEEAIQKSDATIVLLTRNSATSPSVNQELAFAKAKGVRVIPVVEKGVEVGVLLQGLEYITFEKDRVFQICKKIAKNLLTQKNEMPISSENALIDETIVVLSDEFESYDFELEEGETLKINVTSSEPINLYIVDENNCSRFENDRSFEHIEGRENIKKCKISFTCEEEGLWTVILDNTWEEDIEVNIEITKLKKMV